MNVAGKLTTAVIGLLLLVGVTVGVIGQKVAYNQIKNAVGIELIGCANITTGLIDPNDLIKLLNGDKSVQSKLDSQINWTVDHKMLFKEAFIVSTDGQLLVIDKRMVAKGMQVGEAYPISSEDITKLLSMKHGVFSEVYEYKGESVMSGYAPIFKDHDPTQEIVAFMAINFDSSIIRERTFDTLARPFAVGGAVLLIASMAAYFIIVHLIKPLGIISSQLKLVAAGDLSLQPLSLKGKDEIGQLATDLNQMVLSLRRLIVEVSETSMHVAASSEQLTASADQTGKSSEAIAEVAQELAIGSADQLHNLQEGSEVIVDMSRSVGAIAERAGSAAKLALETADKATSGQQSMQSAVHQMEAVQRTVTHLSGTIEELDVHSKEIGQIIGVISDISTQTNLLSLNASIEAARAGDHGRGFAVVAQSVKKLAEQSNQSAKQVANLVDLILASMLKAADNMNAASQEVEQGAVLVRTAGEEFEQIRQASTDNADRIESVSISLNEVSEGAERVVGVISNLLRLADQTSEGTQNVSAATEQQLATMQEISASSTMLSKMAEQLQSMIEKFKT
jgi:methyl-accepting chemotaxis protein